MLLKNINYNTKNSPASFVLADTNVILEDPEILIDETKKFILTYDVFNEIENLKCENNHRGYLARRAIDFIHNNDIKIEGLEILDTKKVDNRLIIDSMKEDVSIYTNDKALRIKAKSLGARLFNEEVEIKDIKDEYSPLELSASNLSSLYINKSIEVEEGHELFFDNRALILKDEHSSALAKYKSGKINLIEYNTEFSIKPKNAEQRFLLDAILDDDIPLVCAFGPAGTGKTLITLLGAIMQRKKFKKILISRPTVEMGQKIGFIPGEIEDKIEPYLAPIKDNLELIANSGHKALIERLKENKKITIEPLGYIRGRSLHDSFLIVDEAQNLSKHEILTILTRAASGTKIVLTGDPQQVDQSYLRGEDNGILHLLNAMKGSSLFQGVRLESSERSPLVKEVLKRF